jgi:D-alanine-D-alanine ligase
MTIDVDPDWWKTLFDEVYLLTDARSVDNAAVTKQEIDVYTALAPVGRDDGILDLCGGHGRHALELCRRGYAHCTVLDYARPLLEIGKQTAAREGLAVEFVQGDARRTAWADGSFDHVLILGNSLGYIAEPDADLEILKESARLLKPGGGLVLDVTDGEAVSDHVMPQAWHEIGEDMVVCRQREVHDGCVNAREMVLSKTAGLIRDRTYRIRLYTAKELTALVDRAGLGDIQVHTNATAQAAEADVGCMNHRLVVTARKL